MQHQPQGRVSRETRRDWIGLLLGAPPTNEEARRLDGLSDLLQEVAVARGFISPRDRERIFERHVLDALRAAPLLPEEGTIADVGSGAGVPGLPLAVVRPGLRFVLIEPRQARVAFLEAAAERLNLGNVTVHHGRVEAESPGAYSAALARAYAPLERAWNTISPVLRPDGRLIFFAGASVDPAAAALDGARDVAIAAPSAEAGSVLESSGPLIIITA